MTQAIDTFIRVNQSGWGTASDGETWVKLGGTTPTLAISSNTGTWTGVTGSATYALGTNTFTDAEVSVRLKITNAGDSVGIVARCDGTAANFYRAFAQNTTLTLSKTVAGTTTSLTTGAITFNTATLYWLKLRVIGNGVYARWWADGSSEPSTWTLSSSDTAVTSAGRIGVRNSLNATSDTVSIDSFTANQLTSMDITSRFRLMSANQLKDVVTRFRLRSADQLKDVVTRFRLMSANQLKDVTTRFRLMSANQLKDISSRFRLMSANQLKDIASRFRLMSANQLKDVASRFRLMSASQLKDVASRFRVMQTNTKDISTRFRLAVFKDVVTRFRLMSANQLKDIAARFRLMQANSRDIASRFRVMSATQFRDIATRFRLAVFRDIATRFRLMQVNSNDITTRFYLAEGISTLVIARGRDGLVAAYGRDGIVIGRGR